MSPYSETNKSKMLNNLVIKVNEYLTFQTNSLNVYPQANKLFYIYMERKHIHIMNKLFIQVDNLVQK